MVVTDPTDDRLADFRDLMGRDSLGRTSDIVIGEGANVVERVTRSPYRVRAVVGVSAKLDSLSDALGRVDAPVYEVDKWVLSEVVGFRVTRGVVVSVDRPAATSAEDVLGAGSRFLVCETINDFENLGAIFRNAAAFGVDGVLLDGRCSDPLYRRSVRVSMGHVFGVPFAVLDGHWPDELERIRSAGVRLVAMTPRPSALSLAEVARDGLASDRWAVMLGAEGPGLGEQAFAAADVLVRIPMADGVDSLNVATAGAVALSHLTR